MDAAYRQRVWKVSSELDRLALLCEQHKLQMAHRDGLEDWKLPPVPAGLPTREPVRAPAFFAWGSDAGVVPDSARKAANTPRTSDSHESMVLPAQLTPAGPDTPVHQENRAISEAAASRNADAPRQRSASDVNRSLDFVETPARTVTPHNSGFSFASAQQTPIDLTSREDSSEPTPVERHNLSTPAEHTDSPQGTTLLLTPSHPVPSPRYRRGRGILGSDLRLTPAGISTVAADRFKRRASFRSPDWEHHRPNKRLSFLESQVQLAHEAHEQQRADSAKRPSIDGSFRRRRGSFEHGRKYVLSGPAALDVARSAEREFLGGYLNEDATPSSGNRAADETHGIVAGTENKGVQVESDDLEKRLVPPRVIDSTTQTDEDLSSRPQVVMTTSSARKARTHTCASCEMHCQSPLYCEACALGGANNGRARKTQRTDEPSRAEAGESRRPVTPNPHLTNPILLNPRYPPEPSAFRSQTSYRRDFAERRLRR